MVMSDSVIDVIQAREMFETQAAGDVEFYNELVAIQLEEGEKLLAELDESVKAGDRKLFHRVAHTMKGTAATFGLARLRAVSSGIERGAKEQMPGNAAEEAELLKMEYHRGLEALQEFQKSLQT